MSTSTAPTSQARLGVVGWARWIWRQLTSMRTALVLLLLLAIAAIPGSIWPQRSTAPERVRAYLIDNPTKGEWLDRLGFFEVYSSPWFSAIYLLLVISLIGCIVPRTWTHLRDLRKPPPRAPRQLRRLPAHTTVTVPGPPQAALAAAREVLASRRMRVRGPEATDGAGHTAASDPSVAAQNGLLKESGNIVFHIALLGLIIAAALGHLLGWRGDVIVPVGSTFANATANYDAGIAPGPWVDVSRLQPFTIRVDDMDVQFESDMDSPQRGQPRHFSSTVTTQEGSEAPRQQVLGVNRPIDIGGASAYLLGNGYAPVITVRDAKGQILYSQATPFLPDDGNYRSNGAVKVPAASPKQLGLVGWFIPTLRFDEEAGPLSDFPQPLNPALVLAAYEGDLYDGGRPQSVYSLDTERMTQLTTDDGEPVRLLLQPGKSYELPGGRGTVTFDGVQRWAGLSIRHDPGRGPALVAGLTMLAGLLAMLLASRYRVFVRATPAEAGARGAGAGDTGELTEVTIAALARSDDPRLHDVVADIAARITELTDPAKEKATP